MEAMYKFVVFPNLKTDEVNKDIKSTDPFTDLISYI